MFLNFIYTIFILLPQKIGRNLNYQSLATEKNTFCVQNVILYILLSFKVLSVVNLS